ncbi:MarR family winged helix-turn-helix transcriptional regulator [Cellulomonas soli]
MTHDTHPPTPDPGPCPRPRDAIDDVHDRWSTLRPDLDLEPMAVVGRLLRLVPLLMARCETFLAPHGLSRAEFDLLTALHRADRPVSPGDLTRQLLFTGPATTKRLRRLEDAGWITRRTNPDDARGFLIEPTPDGARRFDALLPEYVAFEATLVETLDPAARADLAGHLRTLLVAVEG